MFLSLTMLLMQLDGAIEKTGKLVTANWSEQLKVGTLLYVASALRLQYVTAMAS